MLRSLLIKQYALIEELSVEFEPGLNIITGETGAGKSIIIDALSLILGERADSSEIRKGADKAVVEGVFDVVDNTPFRQLLERQEIEFHDELILRREVSAKGQSRCFINDSPVSAAVLKEVGDALVDLHGQHEHQSLLRTETHLGLLDNFGRLDGLTEEFEAAYRECRATLRELLTLKAKERELRERKSLYEFQIKEIDAVAPRAGEEDELENELNILENSEKLFAATERLYAMLYEGENAVHDQLIIARNELETLGTIDPVFKDQTAEAASAAAIVDELAKFIQSYNSHIEFKPERLEHIRDRLGHLALLKKKYGGSLDAVVEHRAGIGREYELASNFETEQAGLKKKFDQERAAASEIASRLSSKRFEISKKVNSAVVEALRELGIANAVFEISIRTQAASNHDEAFVKLGKDWLECTSKGIDLVEFYVSTNAGEDPKPLARVASGGEISRIMLSLKMILAKSDRLPLLIFDEIDVGVSGRIAQAVGKSMKNLSRFHQVIAITHLPQIAGAADVHFVVEKSENRNRSTTRMRKLSLEERVGEVAKLMSGEEVTDSGRKSARELMGLK